MPFTYAIEITQGLRPEMEDAYCLEEFSSYLLAGVFDGHGGNFAANYASQALPIKVKQGIKSQKLIQVLTKAFEEISQEIEAQSESGTTALTILLNKETRQLIWANAGDCRLIIVKIKNPALQLTPDHRVDNPQERERIIKMRIGYVSQGYVMVEDYGLMPTRTLGDAYFKKAGVIATPETGIYNINKEDKYIIMATDGLWDELSNEEVAWFAQKEANPKLAAKKIKQAVFSKGGSDNLTIIVIKI